TVVAAGTVITGAVVSATVTVKDAVLPLPRTSVAVHVTVVAPIGNVDPLAGVQETLTAPSTRSVAVASKVKTAPGALVAWTVAFAGTVMTGAVVSVTTTVNDAAPLLPRASVAAHVTVVVPTGNVDPLTGG